MQVYVLGALPLNAISRAWGWANNLTLPVWFRPFGFKLYSRIFGCNLDEMKDPDLRNYKSLGEFFYRELKEGVRPVEESPIVSASFPARRPGYILTHIHSARFRPQMERSCTLVRSRAAEWSRSRESPTPLMLFSDSPPHRRESNPVASQTPLDVRSIRSWTRSNLPTSMGFSTVSID